MKTLFLILFSLNAYSASTMEFLERVQTVPSGDFKNCEIRIDLENEGENTLLHVYLKDRDKNIEGYSLFPMGASIDHDKVIISKRRAVLRMVNDLSVPRYYEDFVLEWKNGKLEFIALRKFKSHGIFWNFDFNIKCGTSKTTI